MKNIVRHLTIMALMVASATLWAQTTPVAITNADMPYICDFENDADTMHWGIVNGTETNAWYIGQATSLKGSRSLYVSKDNGMTNTYSINNKSVAYAYLPVTFSQVGEYSLTFDWRCSGEVTSIGPFDYLKVFLVPDTTTLTAGVSPRNSWMDVSSELANAVSINHFFSVIDIDASKLGSYLLVFCWQNDRASGNNPPAAVDNLKLKLITCHTPDNLTVTPSQTSAVIEWNTHGDETAWIISLNNQYLATTNTRTYTLTDLTPNNPYEVTVAALCGPGDTSEIRKKTFHTACLPMEIPYAENFATNTPGEAPDCWNILVPTITENYNYYTGQMNEDHYPIIANEGISGNNYSMSFMGESGVGYTASSAIPLPGNAIHVSFLAMGDLVYGNMWMQAGVMSDLSDTSSFIPLVNVDIFDQEYHLYEFNTSSRPSTDTYYLAFKFHSDYYQNNIHLDEIQIREDEGCFIPGDVTIVSTEPDAVTLSWVDSSAISTSYNIYYSTENDFSTAQMVNVDTIPYRLDGLVPNTTYYCWVSTVCNDLLSYSRAFPAFSTHPACAEIKNAHIDTIYYSAVTIGWEYDTEIGYTPMGAELILVPVTHIADTITATVGSEDTTYTFSGLTPNSKYRIYFRSICSSGTSIDTSDAIYTPFMTATCADISTNETNVSIHAPLDCLYGYSYSQMLYTRDQMPPIDTIHSIAFKAFNTLPVNYYVDIYMGHTVLDHLDTNIYVPFSDLHLVSSNSPIVGNQDPGWIIFNLDSPFVYDGTRNLVIAIDNNTNQWIDDIEWNYHPTDTTQTVFWYQDYYDILPSNPEATDLGTLPGVLDIRFEANCNEPECFAPILTIDSVSGNTATIEWPISGTENTFVPAYREASSTVWTVLDTISGTSYTFTNLVPGKRYELRMGSLCDNDTLWDMVTTSTDCDSIPVPYSNNFASLADNETVPCWNYNSTLVSILDHTMRIAPSSHATAVVLPPTLAALNTLELRVTARIAPYDSLIVGVTNDDGETIQWIDTLHHVGQTLDDASIFYHRFTDYMGNGTRVAFSHTASAINTLIVDNVALVMAPTCMPPYDLNVQNLDNPNGVTVNWSTRGSADTWQVVYDTLGASLSSTTSTSIISRTSSCTLPPLQYGQSYQVWVKSVCEDVEEQWVSIVFTTEPFVCHPVTGLNAQVVDAYTANISWNPTEASEYLVFTRANNDQEWTINSTENDSITITHLLPLSQYTVYVKTVCANGDTSVASETASFTTPQEPCYTPTELLVSNITDDEATIAWTAMGSATRWLIEINNRRINVTSNPYTVNYLIPSTSYIVRVRAICQDGDTSDWSAAINFSTLSSTPCYSPLNFSSRELTAHSVTLTWAATNGETNWEIELGDSVISVRSNPYTILGLAPTTPYSARIRALCTEQHASDWSVPIEFTTLSEQGIDAVDADNVTLFPNPASSSVTITGIGIEDIATVVDLNGRLCGTWHSTDNRLTIDISALSAGTYFVHIVGPQISTIQKLIVQ